MNGQAFEFARPGWVYFVLPGGLMALAAVVWLGMRLRAVALGRWAPAGAGRIVLGVSAGKRTLKLALVAGGWALVCVAVARPQWGVETTRLPKGGTDLMVLVDVSNSMLVKDMGEDMSRLERARWKIMDLVDELGRAPVHRVGLMPFAGEPFELAPPTPDYDAIRFFVEDIGPGSVAVGGSNLARAIDRAAEILDRLPGKQDSILVISDGDAIDENEPGAVQAWREAARRKAVAAARDARLKGIRVFALGVGGSAAGEVTAPDGPGGTSYVRFRDESGQERIATSALSEATLAAVAAGAGPGQMDGYVRTTRDDSDIRFLLARGLVAGGASGTSDEERSIPIDRFRWPLLAAFVLLLAELFVPEAGPRHRDEDDGDMKGAGP